MSKIDQFESLFRSAAKAVFERQPWELPSVLLIADIPAEEAQAYLRRIQRFLAVLGEDVSWSFAAGEDVHSVEALLGRVDSERPALIATYRNLYSESWRWPYSLGEHLDVLTQHSDVPILVLPHPRAGRALEHALENTDTVMALTSHMTGDASLVNAAARLTTEDGILWLTHVEDQAEFERTMAVIEKIPAIDTETARETILTQLLKDPVDYIRSCRDVLHASGCRFRVEELVVVGHKLAEYKKLVLEHEVDLLVMHTKDEDQLAMHGMAHSLAVELREIPLLLI